MLPAGELGGDARSRHCDEPNATSEPRWTDRHRGPARAPRSPCRSLCWPVYWLGSVNRLTTSRCDVGGMQELLVVVAVKLGAAHTRVASSANALCGDASGKRLHARKASSCLKDS